MSYHLSLQYPFDTIQVALSKNGIILETISLHKFKAIALTIPTIETLLSNQSITLDDIDFIGVNIGPAPYNTLRGLLTMTNGIHYAKKIPLVSETALNLMQQEYRSPATLVVIQAFIDHVFYRLKTETGTIQKGSSIDGLIAVLNQESTPLLVVGNAATLYKDLLIEKCLRPLKFTDPIPEYNSIETLSAATYKKWLNKEIASDYLYPLYFDQANQY